MGSNVRTQPNIGTQTPSAGLVNSLQVTTTRGTLISLLCGNMGLDQFIQFWDATGPADPDAILLYTCPAPGGSGFGMDTPIGFSRGILVRNASLAVSATPAANPGAANCWFLTRHI